MFKGYFKLGSGIFCCAGCFGDYVGLGLDDHLQYMNMTVIKKKMSPIKKKSRSHKKLAALSDRT